jgi:beta-lactam-binding protein with PASTA domain
MTYVPNLHGYKYLNAVSALHDHSLNVTALVFDKSVRNYSDSLSATVYSQRPAATGYPTVMGTGVTLYLKLDAEKPAE